MALSVSVFLSLSLSLSLSLINCVRWLDKPPEARPPRPRSCEVLGLVLWGLEGLQGEGNEATGSTYPLETLVEANL